MEVTFANNPASSLSEHGRALAPREDARGFLGWVAAKYNRLHRAMFPKAVKGSRWRELQEVRELASTPSDIDEHLELMFFETLLLRPQLIVELGVRGGVSTSVFKRAAALCGASLVSVDIEDCSVPSAHQNWLFVQDNDVVFARSFRHFCETHNLPPFLELLFIDTSHYYQHTVEEIAAWFPLLAPRAKVIFHDTNLKKIGARSDGCFQLSWDNDRGVIRAIEEYLHISIDEKRTSEGVANGWLVRHWPNCNGLTILDRLPDLDN